MKRNCYFDLRFGPPSASQPQRSINDPLSMSRNVFAIPNSTGRHMLDVTELQARVIISVASQEREGWGTSHYLQSQALLMHTPQAQVFTIKKSLRNFLQKRKKRSQKPHPHCISQYSTT